MKQPRNRAVWIARHGERIDFVDPHWSETSAAPYNPPLSPNGRTQAEDLATRLRDEPLAHIFSSPFRRTLETASFVAAARDLPIKVENGLGEMLSAEWFPGDPRDWSLADLARDFFRVDLQHTSLVNPAYPEDWEQCKVRAAQTVRQLVERFAGDLLLLVHGATLASTSWGLVDGYPQMNGGCCSLIKLVQENGGAWRVALDGDTSYLRYREPQVRFS